MRKLILLVSHLAYELQTSPAKPALPCGLLVGFGDWVIGAFGPDPEWLKSWKSLDSDMVP